MLLTETCRRRLADILLAASLAEEPTTTVIHRFLSMISSDLGARASIEATVGSATQEQTVFPLRDSRGEPLGFLVFDGILEAETGATLARVLSALAQRQRLAQQQREPPTTQERRHDVANALATLMMNLELAESLLPQRSCNGTERLSADSLATVHQSIELSLAATRALARLLDG